MSNLHCPRSVSLSVAFVVAFGGATTLGCNGGGSGGSGGSVGATGGTSGAAGGTSGSTGGTVGSTGGTIWTGEDAGTRDTGLVSPDAGARDGSGVGGTGGAGGTGGSTAKPAGTPGQSCKGLAATCGPAGNESCSEHPFQHWVEVRRDNRAGSQRGQQVDRVLGLANPRFAAFKASANGVLKPTNTACLLQIIRGFFVLAALDSGSHSLADFGQFALLQQKLRPERESQRFGEAGTYEGNYPNG